MFVPSCTEFRCMFINVSDLVFPFHSLAPVLRGFWKPCVEESLVGAINLVVNQSTVPVCVLRRYLGRHGGQ